MRRPYVVAILLLGAAIGAVIATAMTPAAAQSTPNAIAKRYEIHFAVGTRAILLDSATGETWSLDDWKSWVAIPKKGE